MKYGYSYGYSKREQILYKRDAVLLKACILPSSSASERPLNLVFFQQARDV
jgi:hypothetical protein